MIKAEVLDGYEDLSQAISDTQLALKAVVASQGQMGAEDPLLRVSVQYMETQLKGLVLTTDSLCHFQTSHKVNQQKVMDRVDVVECDLDSLLMDDGRLDKLGMAFGTQGDTLSGVLAELKGLKSRLGSGRRGTDTLLVIPKEPRPRMQSEELLPRATLFWRGGLGPWKLPGCRPPPPRLPQRF